MQNNDPYASILEKVFTAEQQKESIQLLRDAHQGLFAPNTSAKDILEESLPVFLTEALFEMAKQKSIPLDDTEQLQKLVDDLRVYLEKLPTVEIVLAFLPTYRQVQKIAAWWEEYTGFPTIVSIVMDETILAGAKISYNGIYKDFSLRQWLAQNASSDTDQFI